MVHTINSQARIQSVGASPAKKVEGNNGIVTAEYILERIWAAGVLFVGVDGAENRSEVPVEYTFDSDGRRLSGVTINISQSMLQRMISDPDFREEQFTNIRIHVEHTERFPSFRRLSINQLHGGINVSNLADIEYLILAGRNPESETAEASKDGTLDTAQDEAGVVEVGINGLNVNLLQLFAQQFAERGNIRAMQNEMFLIEQASNAYDRNRHGSS